MSDTYYLGIYQGSVVDNNDPLGAGRVTCLIPQVLADQTSPWCQPVYAASLKPDVGDIVYVQFINGDPTKPIYFSSEEVNANRIVLGSITDLIAAGDTIDNGNGVTFGQNGFAVGTGFVIDDEGLRAYKSGISTPTASISTDGDVEFTGTFKTAVTGDQAINGNFEAGFDGWGHGSRFSSLTLDTVNKHSGTQGVKAAANATSGVTVFQIIDVEPGMTVTPSLWVKTTSDYNGTSGNGKLRIGKNDANSTFLTSVTFPVNTAWNQVSAPYTVPADGSVTQLQITIVNDHTVGTLWFDDFALNIDQAHVEIPAGSSDILMPTAASTEVTESSIVTRVPINSNWWDRSYIRMMGPSDTEESGKSALYLATLDDEQTQGIGTGGFAMLAAKNVQIGGYSTFESTDPNAADRMMMAPFQVYSYWPNPAGATNPDVQMTGNVYFQRFQQYSSGGVTWIDYVPVVKAVPSGTELRFYADQYNASGTQISFQTQNFQVFRSDGATNVFYAGDAQTYMRDGQNTGTYLRLTGGIIDLSGGVNGVRSTAINATPATLATSVGINSAGTMYKGSSSLKYKTDVRSLSDYLTSPEDTDATVAPLPQAARRSGDASKADTRKGKRTRIIDIEPIIYKDKIQVEHIADGDTTTWGPKALDFVGWSAESVADAGWEELVTRDYETGDLEGIQYDRMLIIAVHELKEEVDSLRAELASLKAAKN